MSVQVQFDEYYKTDITYDCSQPQGPQGLADWLYENEYQVITSLDIGIEDATYLPSPRSDISICQLYYILHFLPSLTSLSIYGMVLSPCDHPDHLHLPPPPCLDLRRLRLSRIACRFPFETNPLSLFVLAPHLSDLHVEDCHALLQARGVPSSIISAQHPQAQLPAAGSCLWALDTFEVTFPTAYDRRLWHMVPSWYDFSTLLPTNRRTQSLKLYMIDPPAVAAASAIIMEDAGTIQTLWMEFQPGFQDCPADAWANLSFAGCVGLRVVTLRVAIYHLNGSAPGTQKTFDALRGLISKFPVGIEEIHIDLLLCEQGDIFKMLSLEAMPWAGIDIELEAMQSTSRVVVYPMGTWLQCQPDRTRTLIETGLSRTLARGRLVLEPTEFWRQWESS